MFAPVGFEGALFVNLLRGHWGFYRFAGQHLFQGVGIEWVYTKIVDPRCRSPNSRIPLEYEPKKVPLISPMSKSRG